MSDQLGPIETSIYGVKQSLPQKNGAAGDDDGTTPHLHLDDASIDVRLNALVQTIRTWDWRTTPVGEAAPVSQQPEVIAEPPDVPTHAEPQSTRFVRDEPLSPTIAESDSVTSTTNAAPRHQRFEAQEVESTNTNAPVTSVGTISDPATVAMTHEFRPPDLPVKTRSPYLMVLPWVLAVLMVVAIILGIRLLASHPNPGTLSPTTVAHQHAPKTAHPAVLSPTATQFSQYAQSMENANGAASLELSSAGATPSVAQVNAIAEPYAKAVTVYGYQLHFIVWPLSMKPALQNEFIQLKAFSTFLQSSTTVAPGAVAAWLAQLHAMGTATQTVDNVLRHDLGLGPSTPFQ
jgi:hypothetical protein